MKTNITELESAIWGLQTLIYATDETQPWVTTQNSEQYYHHLALECGCFILFGLAALI